MKCVGIIWSCALLCKNDIFLLLNNNVNIISTFTLNLGSSLEDFVREIYPEKIIATWKVEEKLKYMRNCSDSTNIIIIIFDIECNDIFFHPYKNCYVNAKLELLKTLIRQVCSKKMSNYFYDISFHCSDNEEEFYTDLNIIQKYQNHYYQENG